MPIARSAVSQLSEMVPGRLLTYNELTVTATILTAAAAIKRPSAIPAIAPKNPNAAASPKNATSTAPRVAPSARSMPISKRRRTTDTEIVL